MYSIFDLFGFEEGTLFITVTTDSLSDQADIVMIKNNTMYFKILGEWRECILTGNWIFRKFEKYNVNTDD